jgi:hypothetical protein
MTMAKQWPERALAAEDRVRQLEAELAELVELVSALDALRDDELRGGRNVKALLMRVTNARAVIANAEKQAEKPEGQAWLEEQQARSRAGLPPTPRVRP